MSAYDEQPWTALYTSPDEARSAPRYTTPLAGFEAAVRFHPDLPLITYFDESISFTQVDRAAAALACGLTEHGVRSGDRVGLYLQNVPHFIIGMLASWKLGAVVVPLNPMLRERELERLLADSTPRALICLESLHASVVHGIRGNIDVPVVVTVSELDYQSRNDARLLGKEAIPPRRTSPELFDGTLDFAELLRSWEGQIPDRIELEPDDVAVLTYTSGTTGVPKAAMNSHGNLVANGMATRDWMALTSQDRILGVAPLFHVTGLVCQIITALVTPAPVVLTFRFEPDVMLDSLREHHATFAIGAVTAFVAMMEAESVSADSFSSMRRVYSGGAPVSPAIARAFAKETGHQLHNCYGLTESSAPTHFVPFGAETPVDPQSGALSIGIPTPGTQARIVDEDGGDVPPGEVGELLVKGPQVVSGYWHRPEETATTIDDGWLHTGDVAFMDAAGWFFLVDRKKDMIIASGYKVWPREVEDAFYEHPAVREVAVVGVPDEYRGETVKAYVALRSGASTTPKDLVQFGRERLSAYKYPREIEILDDLPKTSSGKILRRELRPGHRDSGL